MPSGRSKQVIRISLVLCAMYAVLAARLYHVQVTEAADHGKTQQGFQTRSKHRIGASQFERPARAGIFDRHGKALALGFDTFELLLDMYPGHKPRDKKAKPLSISQRIGVLCGVLDDLDIPHKPMDFLDKAQNGFYTKVVDGKEKVYCKRGIKLLEGVTPWQVDYIRKVMANRRIANFGFIPEATRVYPEGELVTEIVGFVGETKESNGVVAGRAGLELSMDRFLSAEKGRYTCEKDGHGHELDLKGRWLKVPKEGYDVHITIDVDLQQIARDELKAICAQVGCHSGSVLILDSNTAEILAMASYEKPVKGKPKNPIAPCFPVAGTYEPGSTIKPLFLAMAIQKGCVSWGQIIDVNHGRRVFRSKSRARTVSDSHSYGQSMSVEEIIIMSSNVGMAIIGFEKMGFRKLVDSIRELGLQKEPQIYLHGAKNGQRIRYDEEKPIYPGVSIPFGHQITMSPLALTSTFNVFATGGIYHAPKLVMEVRKGGESTPNRSSSKRLIREDIADRMLDVLEQTVERGTATLLKDLPWHVGAKTGTAQLWGKNRGAFNSSIIAIAPVAAPRLTIYVGLYNVRGKVVTGGRTAGVAMKNIIEKGLRHLRVAPDREGREKAK